MAKEIVPALALDLLLTALLGPLYATPSLEMFDLTPDQLYKPAS